MAQLAKEKMTGEDPRREAEVGVSGISRVSGVSRILRVSRTLRISRVSVVSRVSLVISTGSRNFKPLVQTLVSSCPSHTVWVTKHL